MNDNSLSQKCNCTVSKCVHHCALSHGSLARALRRAEERLGAYLCHETIKNHADVQSDHNDNDVAVAFSSLCLDHQSLDTKVISEDEAIAS